MIGIRNEGCKYTYYNFFFCRGCKQVGRMHHCSIAEEKVPLPLKNKKKKSSEGILRTAF